MHFDGQAVHALDAMIGSSISVPFHSPSHSCLLLSATRADPSQTPLPSVPTQLPLKEYFPAPQMIQSFDVGPAHVWHRGEQGAQAVPLLKLPSGQTVPVEVVA